MFPLLPLPPAGCSILPRARRQISARCPRGCGWRRTPALEPSLSPCPAAGLSQPSSRDRACFGMLCTEYPAAEYFLPATPMRSIGLLPSSVPGPKLSIRKKGRAAWGKTKFPSGCYPLPVGL